MQIDERHFFLLLFIVLTEEIFVACVTSIRWLVFMFIVIFSDFVYIYLIVRTLRTVEAVWIDISGFIWVRIHSHWCDVGCR